ncbi:MAG: ATP-binding protein [Coriobacteriia bacterium]|nr:ATP-binding protein [Coriobacteriia bacterium]
MRSDRVTLTVPARSEFAKTVRMTVAELASRIGMSYDEVDDVRMAAEEAFIYACNRSDGDDVTFSLDLLEDGIAVTVGPVPVTDGAASEDETQDRYAVFILESVCDEFEISHTAEGSTLRLVRRMGGSCA